MCSCIAGTATAHAKTTAPTTTTAPDPCTGSLRNPAEYQNAFDSLVGLGTGWSTADGYVPVALADGRTAWLMSDTLLAPPSVDVTRGPTFVHNSIVVQRGVCFTPVMGGAVEQRDDLIPMAGAAACWLSAGVAIERELHAFCTDVESADGPPGFGFRVTGTSIATFSLPDLTFTGRVPLPFAEPAGVRWGTGATRVGRWTYVYGHVIGAQYVARVRTDRLTTGAWTFWNGTSWAPREELAPIPFGGGAPAMPAFVTRTASGFVAVGFRDAFPAPAIGGWRATRPEGPWRPLGTVTTATTLPGQYPYDARAVDLGRAGWVVVYNVNDPVALATDRTRYGGRIVAAPRTLCAAVRDATKVSATPRSEGPTRC